MTEPTREPESQAVPAGSGADGLPYIKRAPSRRLYDVLLLVPFTCVGVSIGTLASSTGIFRHLGLVVAFAILFAWIRAGLAITKEVHTKWLMVMGGLVAAFLACAYLTRFG